MIPIPEIWRVSGFTFLGFFVAIFGAPSLAAAQSLDPGDMCLAGTGNSSRDITVCTSALNSQNHGNVRYGNLYLARGRALRLRGEYLAAKEDFDAAQMIMPFSAAAPARRGVARRCLRDFEAAIADFDVALSRNPFFPAAYRDRGITQFFAHRLQHARVDIEKALSLDKYDPESYTFLGLIAFSEEKFETAKNLFDHAHDLGHAWAYLDLWRLLLHQLTDDVDDSFDKRMTIIASDEEWPSPLVKYYIEKHSDQHLDDKINIVGYEVDHRELVYTKAFYQAVHQYFNSESRDKTILTLRQLTVLQSPRPRVETVIADILSNGTDTKDQ